MCWPAYREGLLGLSPRVRGNLERQADACDLGGSIPACAGEPNSCSVIWTWKWVYPRVCGGTDEEYVGITKGVGLSPRVRGNQ